MATVENKQDEMVTLEIDGVEMRAPRGAMIIEVTDRAGIDIPRFCYHRKLSIAANCRMCLVDVEKAPKPLPACATPVAEGMKVFTESRRALDAQRNVMEFLLINHPLDCPICDQGGECELQDLAMGYGRSVSRFTERKRVVKDKNIGPLIETDMTRCIHCTRCVRFLEEIAGTAELGAVGRSEHMEITTFVERNINSELSGNIADLCPVGALTDKPFRFSARAWEMTARPYVGTHDCVGSNLYYHTRGGRIMRCVPRDNESINECWLSDRDRYSHFGLAADDRVGSPMIKRDGRWEETDWEAALDAAARALQSLRDTHGGEDLGFLASPRATTEEHYLLAKLARALGSENVDHRLRIEDFRDPRAGFAHMDLPMRDLSAADAIFLVGTNIRHDQPILGHRVRTAWRTGGAKIMDLNPLAWTFHFGLDQRMIVPPQHMVGTLARVARASADLAGVELPANELGRYIGERSPEPTAVSIAHNLKQANRGVVLLGDAALFHPQAGILRALAEFISSALETALMVLPGPANSQGAWLAGSVPGAGGLDARAMLETPRRGYLLYDLEPGFDTANPARAQSALEHASTVVAITAYAGTDLLDTAHVILPLAPVPETDGSYVNADGTRQWLKAAARPPGTARPGWKILRVLGERLGLDGFDFVNLNEVTRDMDRNEIPKPSSPEQPAVPEEPAAEELWRTGPVPVYAGDPLVRRARPLQETRHGDHGHAAMHPSSAQAAGLEQAALIRVRQDGVEAEIPLVIDQTIPPGAVWLPSGTCLASRLGSAWGPVEVGPA